MKSPARNIGDVERNAFGAMSRLLKQPPPIAPHVLACGTQLTRRWKRDGFHGYAPGMAGHMIATYHGAPQACAWTIEGRRLADQLRPGTVTVVAEGHDGHWSLEGPVEVSHVYLTSNHLEIRAAELGSAMHADILDRVGYNDPILAHMLAILSDESLLDDPSARLLIERMVDLLCLRLLRGHSSAVVPTFSRAASGGLTPIQIKRVTDFMLNHLDQPIGLEESAAQVGLSRYHFCTAFRVTVGCTPHAWLTARRMARARRLLTDPGMSISEIALAVGYSTPSAFAASFRKHVGMTPTNFRRQS
jgi:AraC family transcriptional regulator